MKLACIVGAALVFGATTGSPAFAAETPAGGWQEAARCCQPGPLGTCQRWCEPATGAVRGEKPEGEAPAGQAEQKNGGDREKKPDTGESNK